MQAPPQYTLGKRLHAAERSETALAIRQSDGREVVLKGYLGPDPGEADARAGREWAALTRAAGPGIPRALERSRAGGQPILVLERVPGVPLAEWIAAGPAAPEAFLEVAVQLAEALGRVHEARLLHRDLTPWNVLVDPATLRTHLIDFDRARPPGSAAHPAEARPGSSAGGAALHYISPEQTGRTDRGPDSRSDLYSLGAVLYFALAGRPPFDAPDALAVIHGHLARTAVPLDELRPGLPAALSRIVGRLLHKAPEARYQTAHALARDLFECREQWRRSGAIASDLALGTADLAQRPRFSRTLCGRDAELQALRGAYRRAAGGTAQLVLLVGAPGIGRSALIHELRPALADTRGYLALGKFDAGRRDAPYAGFAQLFASLARQLLGESSTRLEQWRGELRAGLGAIAGALVELVPELAGVLGAIAPVPELGPAETRARLGLAVQRFVLAAATPAHPLVLALDDLQWADAASRDLLRDLLLGPRSSALLVLASYRDSEVGASHPLAGLWQDVADRGMQLQTLELRPLAESDCAQLLADALGRSPEQLRPLAAVVARKTGNVPLQIEQFIHHACERGWLRFETPLGWAWDEAALAAADIPGDAVALVRERLGRIDATARGVLELASCAGDRFHVEQLERLAEQPRESLEAALFALCDQGWIAPAEPGFRFAHDAVRQAAQAGLPDARRAQLHAGAARRWLEHMPREAWSDHAFEIADHLNLAVREMRDDERPAALEINWLAGKRALGWGAPIIACHYLTAARGWFRDADWDARPQLALDLFLQSAESELQARDFDRALELLDVVERRPLPRLAAAQLAARRIAVLAARQRGAALAPQVLEQLARFGLRWPAHPGRWRVRWAIRRVDWELRGALDERALHPAAAGETGEWAAARAILCTGSAPLAASDRGLLALLTAFGARSAHRHGYLGSPSAALASYAAARPGALGHLRGTARYAKAALEWSERAPHPRFTPQTEVLLQAFVHAWLRPRRSVLEPLRAASERLFEIGETELAHQALFLRATYSALIGETFAQIERQHDALAERTRGSDLDLSPLNARALQLLQLPLCDEVAISSEITACEQALRGTETARLGSWSVWAMAVGLLGRFEKLFCIPNAVLHHLAGSPAGLDVAFFRGMAAGALAADPRHPERRRCRELLHEHARELAAWAQHSPDAIHMARGIAAERARLRGRTREALSLYTRAIDAALQQHHAHHAAFLLERRAGLLDSLQQASEADSARARARDLYAEWGAHAKVVQLRERLRDPGAKPTPRTQP